MVVYFHRNKRLGFSINKVTQTLIKHIDNKKEYFVPEHTASLSSIIKNIIFVMRHRDKKSINHVTGDIHYCILGLLGCKSVLTIHDTVLLDFNKMPIIKRFFAEYLWFRIPLRIATKVVCISEATKKSVCRYTKRKDIEVIYDSIENTEISRRSQNISGKTRILIVGTKTNKNIERTIIALKGLDVRLTIIGKLSKEQKILLSNCSTEYINKYNLTDDEMVSEYRNADILSFISLFEGFGMPILEANQQGLPIVCSNIPVLKEVAGDSAIFVDPYNTTKIHEAFIDLITNKDLRIKIVDAGYNNIKRFDAICNARRLYMLYESIL